MSSFRRIALVLALALPALNVAYAEESGSESSSRVALDGDQAQAAAAPQAPAQSQVSVQERIRARRAQRRAEAIHAVYDHLYEIYVGAGYLRFTPGPALQRVNMYNWNVGLTRYFNQRFGVTVDGRGNYGTPFVGYNLSGISKPAISHYEILAGPTYRFYMQPKWSVSGRAMAGFAQSNFSGDTNGFGTAVMGLYPNSSTFAASAALIAEYNLTPNLGLRVAPEYFMTGFGSTVQNNLGYTAGIVYRFGKQ